MTDLEQRHQAALRLATRFFMGDADVQRAATRLATRLGELRIPYAICGGLAVEKFAELWQYAQIRRDDR